MYYVRQNLGSNKMVLNLVLALSDIVPKDTSNFTPVLWSTILKCYLEFDQMFYLKKVRDSGGERTTGQLELSLISGINKLERIL